MYVYGKFVRSQLGRQFPRPGLFSIMFYVFAAKPIRVLIRVAKYCFFLSRNDSLGCSLFAIHKDGVACGGNGLASASTLVAVAHACRT